MSEVELYSVQACPFAQRTRMVLAEKAIEFEMHEINLSNRPANWTDISPTGKVPVLLSIDRVKFRRAVVPGDQLRLEAETIRLSGSRGRVRCRSLVDGELVAESRLNFALTEATQA